MRITMLCIGSLGDVQPYIVLGRELMARGHEITLCAFADFEPLVTAEGMRFMPVSGDARVFINNLINSKASGPRFLKEVRDTLRDIIDPFLRDLMAACEGAETIISCYFGSIAMSIAEVMRVPYVQTHYFLMDSNSLTPISSAPGLRMGKGWYRTSYRIAYLLINTMEKYYLADWRKQNGMSPRPLESAPDYTVNGHLAPVLYAMSPLLVPRPTTWAANIHMAGFWLDDRAETYAPDEKLLRFLEAGEKPVYVGFGSMTSGDMAQAQHIVLEAARRCGVRLIVSKGWGGLEGSSREDVFVTDYVPHSWLFPRVAAVVHHGGAGTTAAGLLAGRPTLVIPFGGDQPFWGMRIHQLGLGPKPIPRKQLTARRLSEALERLTSEKRYAVAAREIGERLRLENGKAVAANIIEHDVAKWLATPDAPRGT